MRDDVRGELSLAEFAQSVNLSVWRLCHIFKSDVGMPPIKYLRLLRMERAKGLLESSFLSVKEIAFRVGLNDESHFVRDFKSTYGYSPTLYRAQFNGNGNGAENGEAVEQKPVVQQFAHLFKGCIYLPKIPQKSGLGVWFAPQGNFHIERMAVEAPILAGAGTQMVGGVEAEALG